MMHSLQVPCSSHDHVGFCIGQPDKTSIGHDAPAQVYEILGWNQYRLFEVYHKPHVDEHRETSIFGNHSQVLLMFQAMHVVYVWGHNVSPDMQRCNQGCHKFCEHPWCSR
jgi:hypothetical protein